MSLEDPATLASLPSTASQQTRFRHVLNQVQLPPQLQPFVPLVDRRRAVIDEDPDMRWQERLVIRCARLNRAWMRNILLTLGALLVFVLVTMPVRYLFGYTDVVPAFVASDMRELHSPHSPLAYVWFRDRADTYVAPHVVNARRGTNSSLLVLQSAFVPDVTWNSYTATCEELLSQHKFAGLLAIAEKHLLRNAQFSCVCAPQLGYDVAYIAFRGDTKGGIVHMFNPVDETADAYEELNAERLAQLGVGLSRVEANQNYRFNRARGNFTLLRRTKLSVVGVDSTCQRNRVGLKAAAALEVEECLDLLRLVDVRERAARQYRRGVLLNAAHFSTQRKEL